MTVKNVEIEIQQIFTFDNKLLYFIIEITDHNESYLNLYIFNILFDGTQQCTKKKNVLNTFNAGFYYNWGKRRERACCYKITVSVNFDFVFCNSIKNRPHID